MQEALEPLLYRNVLIWIEDVLVYANSDDEFLQALRSVFDRLRHYGIKLNANRCILYTLKAHWCGRVISENGIEFNEDMTQGLIDLEEPHTAAQLQHFLCGMNWIRM